MWGQPRGGSSPLSGTNPFNVASDFVSIPSPLAITILGGRLPFNPVLVIEIKNMFGFAALDLEFVQVTTVHRK